MRVDAWWPWVFQLSEGIHRIRMTVQGQAHDLIAGLNEVQIKILRLFGNKENEKPWLAN